MPGFLPGIVLSFSCLLFLILLGNALGRRGQTWMYPALTALALAASDPVALRDFRESSYALGGFIAVSLAFRPNAVCEAALSRVVP